MNRIKKSSFWLIIILAVLVVLRMAAPYILKAGINDYLENEISPFTGEIEDLDLAILRGAYSIEDITIKKKAGTLDPFIQIEELEVNLSWTALFKKKVLADIEIESAIITFIDSQKDEEQQLGLERKITEWQASFRQLVPIDIRSIQVEDSAVHFVNYDLAKPVGTSLSQIEVRATNINNFEGSKDPVFSKLDLKAIFDDHAAVSLYGLFDVLEQPLEFDFNFELRDFRIPEINDLLLIYGPVTFTSGTLTIFSELATASSNVAGYVKVFIDSVDVVAPREDFEGASHFLTEIITALGNLILRNDKQKAVAFKAPLEGPLMDLRIPTGEALSSLLENAFDESLEKKLDGSVDITSVKTNEGEKN